MKFKAFFTFRIFNNDGSRPFLFLLYLILGRCFLFTYVLTCVIKIILGEFGVNEYFIGLALIAISVYVEEQSRWMYLYYMPSKSWHFAMYFCISFLILTLFNRMSFSQVPTPVYLCSIAVPVITLLLCTLICFTSIFVRNRYKPLMYYTSIIVHFLMSSKGGVLIAIYLFKYFGINVANI